MARQPSMPNAAKSYGAAITLSMLVVCCASPTFAAKPDVDFCKETRIATLDIPAAELTARIAHHEVSLATLDETAAAMESNDRAPERYFAPQAEAAIWNAFANSSDTVFERRQSPTQITATLTPAATPIRDQDANTDSTETVPEPKKTEVNARLPGISDDELVRYKKQMFRRDI